MTEHKPLCQNPSPDAPTCERPAQWEVGNEDGRRFSCGRHLHGIATQVYDQGSDLRMMLDRIEDRS